MVKRQQESKLNVAELRMLQCMSEPQDKIELGIQLLEKKVGVDSIVEKGSVPS